MNITIIAGARPNFMKIAPLVRIINKEQEKGKKLSYRMVYTGSSSDFDTDRTLFSDLEIPQPDVCLEIDSNDFFERLAGILVSFARDLESHPADLVMVVDDMTPTMACSIAAKKKGVKVAHLIAGIRSFDMDAPKEVNRMITDGLSDYFFTAGINSNRNLNQTGTEQSRVYFVGNILIDTLRYNCPRFIRPNVLDETNIKDREFILFTLNRRAVCDNSELLKSLIETLIKESKLPVVAPLRNYAAKKIKSLNLDMQHFHILPSLPYLEFGYMEKNAAGIITDSGNVAEEATFLGIPCITLNNYAEHPETVNIGTNVLINNNPDKLADTLQQLQCGKWKKSALPERWDGHTAERIIQILEEIG